MKETSIEESKIPKEAAPHVESDDFGFKSPSLKFESEKVFSLI